MYEKIMELLKAQHALNSVLNDAVFLLYAIQKAQKDSDQAASKVIKNIAFDVEKLGAMCLDIEAQIKRIENEKEMDES